MKKFLFWGVGILALAAAGWSALWFQGRSELEKRIDLEVSRAEAQGRTITWTDRTINGFPAGYDLILTGVAVTDAETGTLVRIPEVRSRIDASSIVRLDAMLLGEIRIDMPITEETRQTDPRLPPVLKLVGENEGLRLVIEDLSGVTRTGKLVADRSDWRVEQDDFPNRLFLELERVESGLTDRGEMQSSSLVFGRLGLRVEGEDGGQAARMELDIEDLSLTATSRDVGEGGWEALLRGTDGMLEVAYQTGQIDALAELAGTSQDPGWRYGYAASAGTGVISLGEGRAEVRAERRQPVFTLDPSDAATSLRGSIQAEAIQTLYALPIAPTPAPEAAQLRLAAIDLKGDDVFWVFADPDKVLDRSAAEVLLDIEATVKVTGSDGAAGLAGGPPFELSNISVNDASVSALGGKVRLSGDIELVQPVNLPVGALDLRLTGMDAVIGGLGRAGFFDGLERTGPLRPLYEAAGIQVLTSDAPLTDDAASDVAELLQVLTRPSDDPATRTSEVRFGQEGFSVNGVSFP
ncbi:MAG: DUF2125 domain-containing protein [Pseudomonadota bacterium]